MKRKKLSLFGIFAVSVATLMVNIGWGFETNKDMIVDGNLLVRGTLTANIAAFFPTGGIIMWSGELSDIPDGWALCDGQNNTPNLSGKFVVGYHAGQLDYASIGATGGEDSAILAVDHMPSHRHSVQLSGGDHSHQIYGDNEGWVADNHLPRPRGNTDRVGTTYSTESASHSHDVNMDDAGGGEAFDNRPAYYVLAYIIKL
jgi:microcystin-dependent protein